MPIKDNEHFIREYVLIQCCGCDLFLDDIVKESMEILSSLGYIRLDQVRDIIEKYYPKKIDGWHYKTCKEES